MTGTRTVQVNQIPQNQVGLRFLVSLKEDRWQGSQLSDESIGQALVTKKNVTEQEGEIVANLTEIQSCGLIQCVERKRRNMLKGQLWEPKMVLPQRILGKRFIRDLNNVYLITTFQIWRKNILILGWGTYQSFDYEQNQKTYLFYV